MILRDFLKTVDIQKTVVEMNVHGMEEEGGLAAAAKAYSKFRDMLVGLEPEPSNDILIALPCMDGFEEENESFIEAVLFRKDELDACDISGLICEDPDEAMSMPENALDNYINKMGRNNMPHSYAYEFSRWEEILGAEVDLGSIEKYGREKFAASVLNEMSFNGFSRKDQDERREELEKSVKESERILVLPKEEREEHLRSFEDLLKEHGWEDKRSEEEKHAEMVRLHRAMLWNYRMYSRVLKEYKEACRQ